MFLTSPGHCGLEVAKQASPSGEQGHWGRTRRGGSLASRPPYNGEALGFSIYPIAFLVRESNVLIRKEEQRRQPPYPCLLFAQSPKGREE